MDQKTFNKFREIVYEKSGIALGPGKEALVSARVAKRIRALSIPDPKAYLRFVVDDPTGEEFVHLIAAEDVGGTTAHTMYLHLDSGKTIIKSGGCQKELT